MKAWIPISTLVVTLSLLSCKEQEPRKPISYATGEYIKESVARNKQMVSDEESLIQQIIKKDSAHKYYHSTQGFWYKYVVAQSQDTVTPKFGDRVSIDFDIKDLNDQVIYTSEETQPKIYAVDKQEIMPGIRHALKLMKKEETIVALFPSTVAYGYLGDKNKIGANQPLKVTLTLKEITKE